MKLNFAGHMPQPVFVLGGQQTDFARNWPREGLEIADGMRETVAGGLEQVRLEARDVDSRSCR